MCKEFILVLVFVVIVGVLVSSCLPFLVRDGKKVIAFSSICHMSFLLVGVLLFSSLGVTSARLIIITHGLVSAAIFHIFGEVSHSINSRSVGFVNSAFISSSILRGALIFSLVLNFGVPPSNGFFFGVVYFKISGGQGGVILFFFGLYLLLVVYFFFLFISLA